MTDEIILLFAYHFPPENTIGAARPHRFAKYLRQFGYRVHVFSASDPAGAPEPGAVYLPDPFLASPRDGLGWALEWSLRKFLLPGFLGTRWSLRVARRARAIVRANPGIRCTVISTFPPLGPLLAAAQVAAHERLPWIADFRDPLGDNSSYIGFTPLQRRTCRRLERAFVERADLVIANTDTAFENLRRRYPRQAVKFRLIWNGFDPDERLRPEPRPAGRAGKVISHVGSLYGDRVVTGLLRLVGRLIDAGRIDPAQFRIRQVGFTDPRSMPPPEFIQRAREQGWLEICDPVPRDQARAIISGSDGLLIVLPHSHNQVSAKLFEYLQTGLPVLAYIQQDSPVGRILARSGVPFCCAYADGSPERMEEAVVEFFSMESCRSGPSEWFEEQFNGKNQTAILHGLIQSLPGRAAALHAAG